MELFQFAGTFDSIVFYSDYSKRYLWAYLVCGALCYLVLYAFKAIALFTIARRGGFKHKWMAFVPFFNTYYIGVVSEKNKLFGVKAKYFSLVAAIVEAACFALYVLYYVAECLLFYGGYVTPDWEMQIYGNMQVEVLTYTVSSDLPANLEWAYWVYLNLEMCFIYWFSLAYTIFDAFILSTFFRTYAPSKYVAYVLIAIFIPLVGAILMFTVRNKPAIGYGDYLRELQQRRYAYYRDYMNRRGGGYGGYGGTPYDNGYNQTPPPDPFGGEGASSDKTAEKETPPDDPFSDF